MDSSHYDFCCISGISVYAYPRQEAPMKIPRHPTLLRRQLDSRIRKYAAHGPTLAASLVEIAKHCGRSGCRCQSGHKHVGHYLTFAVAGKTHTVYVPQDLLKEVRAWIQEHKRMKLLGQ